MSKQQVSLFRQQSNSNKNMKKREQERNKKTHAAEYTKNFYQKNKKYAQDEKKSEHSDPNPQQQLRPRKSKDTKIDKLAKTFKVGEIKQWVSISNESKFVKIMSKILMNKEPFRFKFVIIEKGPNIPEVRYRTTLTLADVKKLSIQVTDTVTTMTIKTRIVAPFEVGTRRSKEIVWSEVRDVEWQNEQSNPNCNVLVIEFDSKHFPQELKTKLIESHPRLKELLTSESATKTKSESQTISKSFKNQKRISLSLKQRSEDDNTIKEKIQGVKISESDSQRSSSQGQLSNLQQQNQDNNRNSKSTLHSNKTRKRKFRSQRRGSQSKNQNDQPNRKHPPQKRQKTK